MRMRDAYTRERTLVSAKETSATAPPPTSTGRMSVELIQGMAKAGRPFGRGPSTETPARVARSSVATAIVATMTAIKTAGRRLLFLRRRIIAKVEEPTAKAVQFAFPLAMPSPIAQRSRNGPAPSIDKPNSLGNWLINTVSAMPFI